MKILLARQIKEWDEYTILNEPISSIELMERAALECTKWIERKGVAFTKVKVFCGKGNNGGDGLAIARQLAERRVHSDVYILEFGSPGTSDFQVNLSRLHSSPVEIHFIQHRDFFPVIESTDFIVDCLFGIGLNRPLEGLSSELVQHINHSSATIVSIDLPSGMYADKPVADEVIIKATYTLTFQQLKLCFLSPDNEVFSGEVHVLDIGLHPGYVPSSTSIYELTDTSLISKIFKTRKIFSHKGTYGHSLIVAGEKGKMGAAVLCTKACLRSGAGLVSASVPEDQFAIIQTAIPEAMALVREAIEDTDFSKFTTIGIGPGLGTGEANARLLQSVFSQFNNPIVLDADALNILAANSELLSDLPPASILSPHPKEFARLFGETRNHFERIQTARYHAQKLFVYIIVKGHYSFVACPDGEVFFNSTGNAGMATGGSGDVLTGILTGLLAQNYSAKETCILGMYIHGLSADLAVKTISQEALIAGDIIDYLGQAFLFIQPS